MESSDSLMMAYLGMEVNRFTDQTQRVLRDLAKEYPNGKFTIFEKEYREPERDIVFDFTVLGVNFSLDIMDWNQWRTRCQFTNVSGVSNPDFRDMPFSTSIYVNDDDDIKHICQFVNYCLYTG